MYISRLPWTLSNWCIFVGVCLLKCCIPKFKHKDTPWRLKPDHQETSRTLNFSLAYSVQLLVTIPSGSLHHLSLHQNSQLKLLLGPLLSAASLQDHRFILVQQLCHEPQPRHWLALPSGPAGSLEKQPSFVIISFPSLLLFPNLSGIELIKSRARNRPDLLLHKN